MTLIDKAEKALEGATPAPWFVRVNLAGNLCIGDADSRGGLGGPDYLAAWVSKESDANLIALTPQLAKAVIAAGELAEAVHAEALAATLELNDPKNGALIIDRRQKRKAMGDALAKFKAATEDQS